MNLRAPSVDDFDALFGLYAAVETAAFGRPESTPEELRAWLTAPTVNIETDVRLLYDDERLVGYVDIDRVDGDPPRWWSDVRVHPKGSASDLVPQLVAWAEERARPEGGILRVWVPTALDDMKRALHTLGFGRIRSSYRMEIALDERPSPVEFEGFTVTPLERGQERVAYDIHMEAFEDSWEHTHEPFEHWAHFLVETESYDPSMWFVAWDGDRPAGASLCRERNGIGWIPILAVRREWRRRGLGRSLLLHSFRELYDRGYRRVGLGVDAESLTGANKLYESVGMRVVRELEFWDKDVPPRS